MAPCRMCYDFHGSSELGLCSICQSKYDSLPEGDRPMLEETVALEATDVPELGRLVQASGTALQRGIIVGKAMKSAIVEFHNMAITFFPTGEDLQPWNEVALAGLAQARTWTPIAVAEMEGLAHGTGLPVEMLARTHVFYEMLRVNAAVWGSWGQQKIVSDGASDIAHTWAAGEPLVTHFAHECTSFAEWRTDGTLLAAQTNDEPNCFFDRGNADVLLRLQGTGIDGVVLTLTHPGMVAFKGCNSHGLIVCINAIDNGERNLFAGVPRPYVARDLLTKHTLQEAVDFIRTVPKTFPLVYLLSQAGHGMVAIEAAPSQCKESWGKTGTILARGNCLQLLAEEPEEDQKSKACLDLAVAAQQDTGRIDVSAAFEVLGASPVFSSGTVETFVCESEKGMYVKFMTDGRADSKWHSFEFDPLRHPICII